MILTKESLQEYLDAMPMAYYAGKPLQLIAERSTTSYADIVNGSIVISIDQVQALMNEVKRIDMAVVRPLVYHEVSHVMLTPLSIDEAIQNTFYSDAYSAIHDDSTLQRLFTTIRDIVNIVEDERIETIMKDAFIDVDFFDNVKLINAWYCGKVPTSARNAFYNMIRLHDLTATPDFKWHGFYNRSRQIISKWSNLQPFSSKENVTEYCNDVLQLYHDFIKAISESTQMMMLMSFAAAMEQKKAKVSNDEDFDDEPMIDFDDSDLQSPAIDEYLNKLADAVAANEDESAKDMHTQSDERCASKAHKPDNESADEDEDEEDDLDEEDEDEDDEDDEDEDEEDEDDDLNEEDEEDDLNEEDEEDEDDDLNEEDDEEDLDEDDSYRNLFDDILQNDLDEEDEELINDQSIAHGIGAKKSVEQIRKMFEQFVFDVQDEKVKQLLSQKFFIKDMHDHQLGAIHKHSGKLDVKAVGRKDWKIFKQPSAFSDGSHIGKKMHLIIVLDQSGSYAGNDFATNKILAALRSAEEYIKAFEFTVIKFGSTSRLCSKNERFSMSKEGTVFDMKLFDLINQAKRQDSANFIIFLNDGAAWTEHWYMSNDIILKKALLRTLDHKNCVCILDSSAYNEWFTKMKTAKIIVTYDYVNKLSDNVCEALGAMLAV